MTILYTLLACWLLWVMYLAVMNLKAVRDRGQLSKPAEYLGWTVLYPGLLLDVALNLIVMTIVLLELPKEWTVTDRVSRHCKRGSGYRQKVAEWMCNHLLNPFDPTGRHCK